MRIKNFLKSFKRKREQINIKPNKGINNIYKEETEELVYSKVENNELINETNFLSSDIKIMGNISDLITPINDYSYKEIEMNLYEQRDFFRIERDKLDNISDGIAVYNRYYQQISRITPLIKSSNLNKMPELSDLKLDLFIPTLKSDLGMFLDEYDIAFKDAAKSSYNARIGIKGESAVDRELDIYRDKVINLSNIRLEVEGTTVESDNIVIASTGLFCLEVKNYGLGYGGIINVSKDGVWSRYGSNGEKIDIDDITAQVYRHIGITQRFLNEELRRQSIDVPYINIKPLIVIANKDIRIENNSDIPILRTSNIYHYMSSYKDEESLDMKYWALIVKVLTDNNKGAKAYSVKLCADKLKQNYREIYYKLKAFDSLDKQLGLANLLEEASFKEHSNLISSFQGYKGICNKEDRKITHLEEVSLRALIDELHMKSGTDRGVYESLILKSFGISNINEITKLAFEYVCKCLKNEINS